MVKAKSTSMNYSAVTCQERRSYCVDDENAYASGYEGAFGFGFNRSCEGFGYDYCSFSCWGVCQRTGAVAW